MISALAALILPKGHIQDLVRVFSTPSCVKNLLAVAIREDDRVVE